MTLSMISVIHAGQRNMMKLDESIGNVLARCENHMEDQDPTYDYHLQNKVVVLIFQGEWCSEEVNNVFSILEPAFQEDSVSFFHIDYHLSLDVFRFYDADTRNLPCVHFFKRGQLVLKFPMLNIGYIGNMIQRLLQDPEEPEPEPEPTDEQTLVLKNYVRTRTYQYMPGSLYLETVQYVDGLGRDLLTISKGITPDKQDLVTLIEYDTQGRKFRTWLPGILPNGWNDFHLDSLKSMMITTTLHGQDKNPYSEIKYEPLSSELVSEVFYPGEVWYNNDKSIITKYYSNSSAYPCAFYYLTRVGSTYVLNKSGNYLGGKLFMTEVIDEDGNISYQFRNKLKQLIMTRQINGEENFDTYFIYDEFGNLCGVLPPKAVKIFRTDSSWDEFNPNVQELCYLYKYDQRNRCIAKKLPGVDWILNVYDNMDRIVMSQDGNLRKKKKWYYNVYDGLDRITRSNIVVNNSNLSRDSIQFLYYHWFEDYYPLDENVQDINKPLQGNVFVVNARLQETNYGNYNDLPTNGELAFKPICDVVTSFDNRTWGLKTREKLYIINERVETTTPNYIEKAYYYDDKARIVQIVTKNKYDKISRESYLYNFKGNLLAKHELHEISSGRKDSILITFEYDHASRMIASVARLNNGPQTCVEYTYNDLGQENTKKLGSRQNVINQTMQYNIRGLLESLSSEVFEMKLRYNNPLLSDTKESYGGNIAEWEWFHKQKVGQNDQTNVYAFKYDSLNRLKETKQYINGNLNNQHVEKEITYDENGNIMTMQRTGSGILVDDLSYSHTGNRLTSLKEGVRTSPIGDIYLPGNTSIGTYTYDDNGNMITDSRRALKLEYNFLNLLNEVKTISGEVKARYTYLSDGTKLDVCDNNRTNGFEYLGSLIYRKNSTGMYLESVHFGDGVIKVTASNGNQEIHYFITDHLGSVRVIVDGVGVVKERNDYYPFGARHIRNDYLTNDNRYRYNEKEVQVTGSLDYLDYGARMYDVELGKWFNIDPANEKYISWSPYNYTLCNPIKYIDPNGMDTWIVKANGEIEFWENDLEDWLYAEDKDFNIIGKMRVTARDRSILDQLLIDRGTVAAPLAFQGTRDLHYALGEEKNQDEMLKLFHFLAEHTDVEWRIDRYIEDGVNKYSLGTIHDTGFSPISEWMGHSSASTIAFLHSHPNVKTSVKEEWGSMGWVSENAIYGQSDVAYKPTQSYRHLYYYTYFPQSKKLWSVENYGPPRFIRSKVNSYKRFLFGTINTR